MRLVWTYSKDYKIGSLNNKASHEYVQWLFRKAIKSAPKEYEKIIYTDKETVNIFEDIVDQVIIRPKKEFIFLADLKFDVAEILNGEFIISDGDLFINEVLDIPDCDLAFEYEGVVKPQVKEYKRILLEEGIENSIPIWSTINSNYYNLGLMYFNNDSIKDKLLEQFRLTQKFFVNYIEPKYKFNENKKQFSACGSQMLVKQFALNSECKVGEFVFHNDKKYIHFNNKRKLELVTEFNKKLI